MRIPARLAVALAAIAMLPAGCDGGGGTSRDALDHVARAVERGEDHVVAQDLAAWRIDGQRDLEVIDLRSGPEYEAGHIDDARHVAVTQLLSEQELEGLSRTEMVVVYASDTDRAAQAAIMLRLAGVDAYSLAGGYRAWQQMVAAPVAASDDEQSEAERERIAVSCYFSGDYDRAQGFTQGAGYLPPLAPVTADCDAAPPTTAGTAAAAGAAALPTPEPEPAGELELIVEEGC